MEDKEIDEFPLGSVIDTTPVHGKDSSGADIHYHASDMHTYIAAKLAASLSGEIDSESSFLFAEGGSIVSGTLSDLKQVMNVLSGVAGESDGGIGVQVDSDGVSKLVIDFANISPSASVDPAADYIIYYDSSEGALRKTAVSNIAVSGVTQTGTVAAGSFQLGSVIFKVGTVTSTTDANEYFPFPEAFPNSCNFMVLNRDVSGSDKSMDVASKNKNGFYVDRHNDASNSFPMSYLAIGY